uniref:Uncharacterized protein n=1 Tax=Thermoanaerobaculum aquaticum TaxID=1312852 RepID=A0A7V2EF33_9BACT
MRQGLAVVFLGLVSSLAAAGAQDELAARLLQVAETRSFDAETVLAAAESPEVRWRRSAAKLVGHFRQESAVRVALQLARDLGIRVLTLGVEGSGRARMEKA